MQELDRKIEALDGQDVHEITVMRAELHAKLEAESQKNGAVGVAARAIAELHPGRPWYSILNGPRNVHSLLAQSGLESLSVLYRDLNATVHTGMPHTAGAMSDGVTETREIQEWIRPIRSYTPWAFRPILAAGLALKVAFGMTVRQYPAVFMKWEERMQKFKPEHDARCRRADLMHMLF